MTAIIYDNPSAYGRGERQALEWVGAREKWVRAKVTRRSARPFDMRVDGTHKKYGDEMNFSGIFLLCALHAFMTAGLTVAPFGDWSFIRDRDEAENWRVFENIVRAQANRNMMVPVFSSEFIRAVWSTWGAIAADAVAMDNEEAIELVLDADRLTTFVGKWADEEFDAVQAEHGYERAMVELARLCKLV